MIASRIDDNDGRKIGFTSVNVVDADHKLKKARTLRAPIPMRCTRV